LISELILEETTGKISGLGAGPTAVLAVVLVAAELVLDHLGERNYVSDQKKLYLVARRVFPHFGHFAQSPSLCHSNCGSKDQRSRARALDLFVQLR
jgi:hypothetical protein